MGCLNFATTHLQSSNMYEAEDMAGNQIKLLMNESPFDEYIIAGDLNNNEGYIHCNCTKNNYDTTWNNDILDYILNINYSTMDIKTNVHKMDITNISDHNPLCANLLY